MTSKTTRHYHGNGTYTKKTTHTRSDGSKKIVSSNYKSGLIFDRPAGRTTVTEVSKSGNSKTRKL